MLYFSIFALSMERTRLSFHCWLYNLCIVVYVTNKNLKLETETPKIIHALVQLFSRVGIPEEILTDQGTNFTSRLMGQLNKQLGITAIRTNSLPPVDGRSLWRDSTKLSRTYFGSSLQTQDETETSGYHLFPSLTERYPQTSTGFSPFELLYGWQVQGPLDLLKKRLGGGTCIQDGGERHHSVCARDARSTGAVQKTS